MEHEENPNYDVLYSGKEGLERDYANMFNKDKDLNSKLTQENEALYSKYRKFQDKKKQIRKKRNLMMKRVLESSSVANHFLGNVPPKGNRKKPQLELRNGGVVVRDEVQELKREKLMGMKNLKDLKGLNITKQLDKREKNLRRTNKKYFMDDNESSEFHQERNLLDVSSKKVKSVKGPSFLLRNAESHTKKGYFKPERGLYQRGRKEIRYRGSHRVEEPQLGPVRRRKLAIKKPKTKKGAKKKLIKKFKKVYAFNWKTLRWAVKHPYKYTLIKSVKELKFWKKMGFTIKKKHVKLFNRWKSRRKYLKNQVDCVLTGAFSPMSRFYYSNLTYFKIIFKSNCMDYTIEKLFKIRWHPGTNNIRITIGRFSFYVAFGHRIRYKRSSYIYDFIKIYPKYRAPLFLPFKKGTDLVKTGLVTSKAAKWKQKDFKFFVKYRHAFPTRTVKQGKLLANIAYRRRYGRWRYLKQNQKAKKEKEVIKESDFAKEASPMKKERELRGTQPRKSRKRLNLKKAQSGKKGRKLWRWQYYITTLQRMIQWGYTPVFDNYEKILVSKADNPKIERSVIKHLQASSTRIVHCAYGYPVRCVV